MASERSIDRVEIQGNALDGFTVHYRDEDGEYVSSPLQSDNRWEALNEAAGRTGVPVKDIRDQSA